MIVVIAAWNISAQKHKILGAKLSYMKEKTEPNIAFNYYNLKEEKQPENSFVAHSVLSNLNL
jgi:hypothetical protein